VQQVEGGDTGGIVAPRVGEVRSQQVSVCLLRFVHDSQPNKQAPHECVCCSFALFPVILF
jgi:hypothetical protein